MSHTFKPGDKVTYQTTGRFPRGVTGVVEAIDDKGQVRGGGLWARVKGQDGRVRSTRLGALRAA